MNRRELIVGSLSGAAIGAGWVAGFGVLLQRQEPTLSVIGKGTSLLALLDTGNVRVLVAAGPGDPRLTRNLSALLGVFRPRIDLLLGSESGVAEFTAKTLARYGNPLRMILDQPTGIAIGTQAATGPPVLTAHLPQGIDLRVTTFVQGAWQVGGTPTQSWIVTVTGYEHRCSVADTAEVLGLYGDSGDAIGVVGMVTEPDQWDMLRMTSLAIPSDRVKAPFDTQASPKIIRLFQREPITITFRPDGLGVRE